MSLLQRMRFLWRRWITGRAQERVSPAYSYRIFWTKQALEWTPDKRRRIKHAVGSVIDAEQFDANPYRRRYQLDGLGEIGHAGESLLVLYAVLEGLEGFQEEQGGRDDT